MLKEALKDLDQKLSTKRTLVNDIRTAIASSAFEKAIKAWDSTAVELRDEALGKQIEQLRSVVVPALKLAEQGENFSRQGRLEEAMSSFEDAVKINPNCEAARQGQKDTEQKLGRIEYMLKEGFQYSLEQNYAKAIDTWKPILDLRPGHAQAMKSIVDACVANAQHLRAHGDLDGALAAYQSACESDPQNRTVRRMLEEVTNLRDKEQALVDRAQDAAARNRLSAAIGYWKEVARINPAS
jgi:tetratricopeptide (TPR) repeat protein